MIPILYKSNETNFFHQGLGPLTEGKPAKVTEARNGEFTFSMEYSIDGKLFSELQNERIIKADAGHALKNQRFVIKHISKPMKGYVKIYAEHVSYKAAEIPLLPNVTVTGTAQQALQQWQNNFIGDYKPFTVSSNITTQNRTSWSLKDVQNARQALGGVAGSILDTWGGEYKFDNFHISLLRERGVKANAMIAYGRNLIDFEQEESILNTYTSIYPYALWRDDEGDEHLITANGYIVDSDYVDNYPNRKVLPVDFTIDFEADEKPTSARLIQLAEQYIASNDIGIPEVSIRLTHQELSQTLDYKDYEGIEEINLCDNVMVKFLKLGVDTTAKVVRIVWNVNLERYDEIEIGAIRTSLSERLNTIDRQVKVAQKDAEDARNYSLVATNGINMVFFGPDEPTATKVGDRWFEENGEYTISRVWDGVIWRVIHDPRITDANKRAIEAHQQDIQDAKASADAANQQINDAINAAGFITLADLTADIQSISTRADANALAAIDSALSASTTAQSAMTLATDLSGQVSDFELTVNGFNQTVNNYTGQVAQFTIDVNGLNSTVASYETKVNEFGNTVSTYATQVSQFQNTVSGLNSTVSSYQSDVQGYQAQVSTLTNTVDGFNATVQRVEADYSNLSGTVQSLGASIGVVEGQITNRVWQTDIQSAVDGIEVGGRNLLPNTSDEWTSVTLPTWNSILPGLIRVETGERVLGQIEYKNGSNDFTIRVFEYNSNGVLLRESPNGTVVAQRTEGKATISYTVIRGDVSYIRFIIRANSNAGGTVEYRRAKLEKGNKATDWSPAPEDTMQLISHVETEWRQTAQGFNQSITRIESDVSGKASLVAFNTLESKVGETIQRIGDAEGNITQIEANVSGLQTTVASKASQTQVTQLSDGFNVLSTNFNNLEIGGRNLLRNSSVVSMNSNNGVTLPITRENLSEGNRHFVRIRRSEITSNPTSMSLYSTIPIGDINSSIFDNEQTVVSFKARANRSVQSTVLRTTYGGSNNVSGTSGPIDITTEWKTFQVVFPKIPTDISGMRVNAWQIGTNIADFYLDLCEWKIERGNKATDWTPAPEDMATQAQFTVLNNNINMRVAKGELMSQINIEAGRTLIQSNRLYLDAQTTVFGGNAFIPGAFIENASIDSAKISEIDANIANIINLNTSDITGLNAEFVRTRWNDAVGGNVSIDAGGIDSTQTNVDSTHYMNLSGGQIYTESTIQGESTPYTSALFGQGELNIASHIEAGTSISVSGTRIQFIHGTTEGTMRFNGTNFVLDNNLGLFGNHINSVNWLRLIGSNDYEMTIHKHPTANGGAIVDSSMVTLGLGVRNSFSSIAQFYGQIDFRRNLHMINNDIREVRRVALHNSNTHFISHPSTATPGGVIVDSTRFTIGIGSVDTGFNDRITVTNSQIDLRAHTNLQGFRLDNVARIALTGTTGWYMHLSTGTAIVDTRMVTIAIGNVSTVDRVADFYGRIDFYKNLNMNGNVINNQSDARLKTNIVEHEQSSLEKINAFNFVDFRWVRDGRKDFGLIAQEVQQVAPELISEDSQGILSINNTQLNMMTTHAIQELSKEHENTLLVASHAYLLAEQHEDELACYKKKIEELEEKVKRLEGAA